MRTLELDFHRRPRSSLLGWAILAAGAAAVLALFCIHNMLADNLAVQRAKVVRIEALLPGTAAGRPSAGDDAALSAARQAVERARLPWDELFSALEAADDRDVAILVLKPDAARAQVAIHAEARHLAAMLAFHRRLQEGKWLTQVALTDHEVVKETDEAPVRFHIVGNWGGKHARP